MNNFENNCLHLIHLSTVSLVSAPNMFLIFKKMLKKKHEAKQRLAKTLKTNKKVNKKTEKAIENHKTQS